MKKALALLMVFIISHFAVVLTPTLTNQATAAGANLIANSSLETSTNNAPDHWLTNAWGSLNASHTYLPSGSDGTKSAQVTVTNYQNGDAKWYFAPVAVKPSTEYVFSDDYKATVDTETVVQFQDAAGVFSYQYLGTNPTTDTWQSTSYRFTTPSNVSKLSVFHLIANNGQLTTDTYYLAEAITTDPGDHNHGNLVANNSAETLSGTTPSLWNKNNWGSNTATFSVASNAQDGARSLYVKVSNYQNGDAKWYFNPVSVHESTRYIFSDYYKATAPSNVFARYEKNDGSLEYVWLGTNAATTAWVQKSYPLTTPAGTKNMSIFHVLSVNGELWTDNFALHEDESNPNPNPSSIILNPSVETAASNQASPANWANNAWGSNAASFSYINDAHTGVKAIKTTVTNYVDGDAKWYFSPVELTPGVDYTFSDYYKSDVDSRIVVQVTSAAGAISYLELPTAPAASSWTKYSGVFTMPAGAKTATVYHMLSRAGTLTTDDYSIDAYKVTGFNRGLVTLTFDDGWEVNTTTALPIMKQHGFLSNQFYATTFIQNPSVTNHKQLIKRFTDAGHEVHSHSITHPDMTTLTPEQLEREVRDSKSFLQTYLGKEVKYFATPYGAYNAAVKAKIMQYYTVHRTVDNGYNSKDNFDVTRLKVQNVLNTTTAAEVDAWVKKAKAEKTWLILVYHRVDTNPGPYDTTTELFRQQMQVVKNNAVPVKTITQALAELNPQL